MISASDGMDWGDRLSALGARVPKVWPQSVAKHTMAIACVHRTKSWDMGQIRGD
ncbi:MAG: hypothetical protein ACO4AI_03525 [Prochlorothrix sp.]|nr:hypothetical protein [Prochlorothrix sp.]